MTINHLRMYQFLFDANDKQGERKNFDVIEEAISREIAQKVIESQYQDIKNLTCACVGWTVW